MHYVKVKGILSAKNGMNLYRGCSHGCVYCDSRSRCYGMEHDFEDIEVKENALELLEAALQRKRWKCMIGMGSMTDPYIPLESTLGYTRKALELAYQYGFGMSLITKQKHKASPCPPRWEAGARLPFLIRVSNLKPSPRRRWRAWPGWSCP